MGENLAGPQNGVLVNSHWYFFKIWGTVCIIVPRFKFYGTRSPSPGGLRP